MDQESFLNNDAERLKLALTAWEMGTWDWDAATDAITVSEGVARIFNLPSGGKMTRSAMRDMLDPADRQRAADVNQKAIAERRDYNIEYRVNQPDGTQRWVSTKGRGQYDSTGKLVRMMGVIQDITDRKTAEHERERLLKELQSERTLLAEVFNRSPSFMTVLRGPQHVFELVNGRYFQLVGHRELLGKTVREAIPEIAGQGYYELLDSVYRSGEPFIGKEMQAVIQREKDGPSQTIIMDLVYQPLRNREGEVTGIFAHGVDLTEHKLAETAVRESESRFRQLADAMPQIVWAAGADGALDYYNKRWFEYINQPSGSTVDIAWDRFIHPDDLPRAYQAWKSAVETGEDYTIEFRVRNAAAAYRWFLVRALPVRSAEQQIVRWYGTCTDIHDQKKLQQQNEQLLESERTARSESERAGHMKDEFLATLSHELRTPLNAILGWAQILRIGPNTPEEVTEGLVTIERNARVQTQIIADLLDMSRIISGKIRLDVQRVDLAPVVQAAIETSKPAAEGKGVRLYAIIDPLAGPVSGDPNRLQQVLWNLLSNAIKFTPKGGRIQVLLERVNSHLEISVSDTGEGIKSEFLPFVFDRFRQADATTTRRHGGLGLGLSIVKQLVELHGGTIRVKSPGVGQGSTFSVSLPLTVMHAEPEGEEERVHPAAERYPSSPDACIKLKGVNVLVVDDEPDARALVKRLLEDCDAIVRTAGSAAEAFDMINAQPPDVLVSDIGMPIEDGYSLIRRVRASSRQPAANIPAIALTAYARTEDRLKTMKAGFQTHVVKPVEPSELITAIAVLTGQIDRK